MPRRTRTGGIGTPHCSRMGTTFKPNYSTIYEQYIDERELGVDPSKMKLIDLSVPEMTDKQIVVAASWSAVESIRKLLAVSRHNPISILESAKTIIDEALKHDES